MKRGITKKIITALMIGGLMTLGLGGEMTEAAVQNTNPYGLVYGNAITHNESGKVNIRPVEYMVQGIKVSANLYLPADYDEASSKTYAAVTVAHPNGGSKEQVAGVWRSLAILPLPLMHDIREPVVVSQDYGITHLIA